MGEVTPPVQASVELGHQEVLLAAAAAAPKPPSQVLYLLAVAAWFIFAMEAGLATAFVLSQNFDPPAMVLMHQAMSALIPAVLFLCGLTLINNMYVRTQWRDHDRQRASRAIPDTVPASYRADDEGLRLSTPRGEWLTRWAAMSEALPAHQGWLFLHDLGSTYLPTRAFADAAAERNFLNAVWTRMSATAQARSPRLAARLAALG